MTPRPAGGTWDAAVVGSGPNGLAAALTLARAGHRPVVFEAAETAGGGLRTAALTLPGFHHDVCAAFMPFAPASPLLRSLPLADHGLRWRRAPIVLAHPLDGGRAVALHRPIGVTAAALGRDGGAYQRLVAPLTRGWPALLDDTLGPLLRAPAHPWLLARFGLEALLPASSLLRLAFREEPARALFAGLAAHAALPLERPLTSAFALLLAAAGNANGWPLVQGGSQRLAEALVACLRSLGGEVITARRIDSLDDLRPRGPALLDVTPRQALRLAGDRFSPGYERALRRFRHGPGVFKLDLALDGQVPWQADVCRRAGVVHVGGGWQEVAASLRQVASGQHPRRPFVILGQQSLFDPGRAPEGHSTVWAYCHVPAGSNEDMAERIEAQIERFAPGFRRRILARRAMTAAQLQAYNPNYVGGDIGGGAHEGLQLLLRPFPRLRPYDTSLPGVYLCSSSTPPGAGIHGMCGYHAARAALSRG